MTENLDCVEFGEDFSLFANMVVTQNKSFDFTDFWMFREWLSKHCEDDFIYLTGIDDRFLNEGEHMDSILRDAFKEVDRVYEIGLKNNADSVVGLRLRFKDVLVISRLGDDFYERDELVNCVIDDLVTYAYRFIAHAYITALINGIDLAYDNETLQEIEGSFIKLTGDYKSNYQYAKKTGRLKKAPRVN